MTTGVKLSNLPDLVNESLVKEFFSKVTSDFASIIIKGNKAEVYFNDDEDLESVLFLDGQEMLGYQVSVERIGDSSNEEPQEIDEKNQESDPEILMEESYKESPLEEPKKPEESKAVSSHEIKQTIEKNIYEHIEISENPHIKESSAHSDQKEIFDSHKGSITSIQDFIEVLERAKVKPRKDFLESGSFKFAMDPRMIGLITILTLISIVLADLF